MFRYRQGADFIQIHRGIACQSLMFWRYLASPVLKPPRRIGHDGRELIPAQKIAEIRICFFACHLYRSSVCHEVIAQHIDSGNVR
jgi:hypothetical protein